MENLELLYLKTITPLHVGGSFDSSIADLPIQRERAKSIPKIEASSLKGSLRHWLERDDEKLDKKKINAWFGTSKRKNLLASDEEVIEEGEGQAEKTGSDHLSDSEGQKGELVFTDARLLFFPVRSAKGIFAYVTCPFVVNRWLRDQAIIQNPQAIGELKIPNENEIVLYKKEKSLLEIKLNGKSNVVLEELSFDKLEDPSFDKFIDALPETLKDTIQERVALVSDDNFIFFSKYSTELSTRIRINPVTGVVEDGALFTEEYVPAEAVFYTMLSKEEEFLRVLPEYFQVGGNMTLGKGMMEAIRDQGGQ